jgi:hypothetical protein
MASALGCAGAAALFASSCGDDGQGNEAEAACTEIVTHLRECELFSEGATPCSAAEEELPGYFECVRPCVKAASCDDLFAQACDDITNDVARCIDGCMLLSQSVDCGDGVRVSGDQRCDGTEDCASGADEEGCSEPMPMFACGGGEMVPENSRCDGVSDCADGQDEAGCPMRAMTICPGGF